MYLEFIKCKYKKIVWQILFWKWKLKLEWLDYSFAMYIFSKPPSKIEASQCLFLSASQGRPFSIFRDLAGRKFVILNCTVCTLSRVQLSVTPWTAAHQAPLSRWFSRQGYWSGLPFLPPGNLLDPGTEPMSLASLALAGRFFTTAPPGKPRVSWNLLCVLYRTSSQSF